MQKPTTLHSINSSVESDVYIFNASNDSALACNNLSYSPTKFVKTFENDLATLPMLFANENDIVLVNEQPTEEYISQMLEYGFIIPQKFGGIKIRYSGFLQYLRQRPVETKRIGEPEYV